MLPEATSAIDGSMSEGARAREPMMLISLKYSGKVLKVGQQAWLNDALLRLHADYVFGGEAAVAHIAGKAARAIAALLDLGTVGVVDDVFEIDACCGRRPHGQDLVGTDAKMAVAQEAVMARGQAQSATGLVEHDKVVAGPLHFGERNAHGVDYQAMVALL